MSYLADATEVVSQLNDLRSIEGDLSTKYAYHEAAFRADDRSNPSDYAGPGVYLPNYYALRYLPRTAHKERSDQKDALAIGGRAGPVDPRVMSYVARGVDYSDAERIVGSGVAHGASRMATPMLGGAADGTVRVRGALPKGVPGPVRVMGSARTSTAMGAAVPRLFGGHSYGDVAMAAPALSPNAAVIQRNAAGMLGAIDGNPIEGAASYLGIPPRKRDPRPRDPACSALDGHGARALRSGHGAGVRYCDDSLPAPFRYDAQGYVEPKGPSGSGVGMFKNVRTRRLAEPVGRRGAVRAAVGEASYAAAPGPAVRTTFWVGGRRGVDRVVVPTPGRSTAIPRAVDSGGPDADSPPCYGGPENFLAFDEASGRYLCSSCPAGHRPVAPTCVPDGAGTGLALTS